MHLFPESRWQDFLGKYYRVIDIAHDMERGTNVVVYYGEVSSLIYVRTLDNWFGEVITDQGNVPRFTYVGE